MSLNSTGTNFRGNLISWIGPKLILVGIKFGRWPEKLNFAGIKFRGWFKIGEGNFEIRSNNWWNIHKKQDLDLEQDFPKFSGREK